MKFRMKAMVAALLLGTAGTASAGIATGIDGNGELVFGLMDRHRAISYLRDLGIRKGDFLNNNVTGVTRSNTLFSWTPDPLLASFLADSAANPAGSTPLQFFVMANDNLGPRSFFTTGVGTTAPALASNEIRALTTNVQDALAQSNLMGTHPTVAHGSNTSTAGFSYLIGMHGTHNNYGGRTGMLTAAAAIGTPLHFFEVLGDSVGTALRTPIRFDGNTATTQGAATEVLATWQFLTAPTEFTFVNEHGALVTQTFAANTLVYHMPNIPVPAALPLLLSGLGLLAFIARRRTA
jgi:hypothetical protein